MFRKHTLKHLSTGIAVAATLAVAAAPSALGAHDTWYGNAVSQNANQPYIPFVTDMSGGNSTASQASGYDPQAYVYGGASPAVSKAIQALGHGPASSPVAAPSRSSDGFSWSTAGIGAGAIAAGLLVLLLCGAMLRTSKRGAVTT